MVDDGRSFINGEGQLDLHVDARRLSEGKKTTFMMHDLTIL